MTNSEKVYLGIGAVGVVAGLVNSAYVHFQAKRIGDKVDMTVKELSEKTTVDIEDAIIDQAVQRAVDREVRGAVSLAANTAVRRVSSDMESQVRKAVGESYTRVEQKVSSEVARQVSQLDINKLRKDVTEQAQKAILEKFDDSLDGVLGEFNRNLENVSKVYGSIAASLLKKPSSEVTFKIE